LHRGVLVVWDSLAIAEYVNETFLDGRGWPGDPAQRAVARAASAEMHSGFQSLRNQLPLNCRKRAKGFVPSAEAKRDIDRIAELWRECRANAGEGEFLFGAFSIADAMYAPVVLRFRTYGIALGDVERRYADAILAMPAIREWLASAEAEGLPLPKYDAIA